MDRTITVRLPAELAEWLEEKSTQTGVPQAQIVREQLAIAKAGAARHPSMRLAGKVRGPKDLSSRKGSSRA